jgi:hypothetical protein
MSKKSIETLDFAHKKSFKTLKMQKKRVCKLFFSQKYLRDSKKVAFKVIDSGEMSGQWHCPEKRRKRE